MHFEKNPELVEGHSPMGTGIANRLIPQNRSYGVTVRVGVLVRVGVTVHVGRVGDGQRVSVMRGVLLGTTVDVGGEVRVGASV